MKTLFGLLSVLTCASNPGLAQLAVPELRPIAGARMPALSPDGQQLAFVYRGDIWITTAKGGRATPVTDHVETDAFPQFSPDGKWIAFASKRNGNWDLYAIPAQGGGAVQLTWHAGTEVAHGWSPDGKNLLFSTRRDGPNHALYALNVTTLRSEVLCEDFAPMNYANYSPNGQKVVYGRYGFSWTRPRYHGSAAAQIWLLDLGSSQSTRYPLTHNEFQHLWTRFMPDGQHLATVTVGEETPAVSTLDHSIGRLVDNPQRTPNLWEFDLEGRGRQLTFFTGGSVRWPTVAGKSGDIAFEYGSDIWLLKKGKEKPAKLQLYVASDEKQTTLRREKLKSGVTEAEPSPDGKTFAFGLHGDIWSVPIDRPKGAAGRGADIAKRLTDWVGEDSDFSWSPDGKHLYFTSDREFTTRIYELELATGKTQSLWNRDENVAGLKISPDGKQLGFWVAGKEGGLYMMDLASRETRRVVKVPGPQWRGVGGGDYAWSPDMRWIAYTYRGESRAWNIWIVPTEGGSPVNVTRLYAQHSQPAWSPDGKYLFFQSNRDGDGLYALPLTQEVIRSSDTDIQFQKPTNSVRVEIEFTDTSRRIRKVASQNPQGDLTITAEGMILFVSDGDLWSVTYDGKETKRLTTGGGKAQLRVAKDGKTAFYIAHSELYTMGVSSKSSEKVTFTADWEQDTRTERQAAFAQFWRYYQRGFYDANFHGRDWSEIRDRYEPLLDAAESNEEFAWVLQMMVGELEASHSEVKPANHADNTPAPTTPHLGFTFDYSYPGPGIKVDKVPFGAPGWYNDTLIMDGDIILAINGRDVNLDERLYQIINDKQDREFQFLVGRDADRSKARTVKYKALTQAGWDELIYRDRTEHLRRYVEDHSHGKIGYLHLAAMGFNNQTKFEREAYEYIVGKEAMIIDVRFNQGGNIADTLIDWLERKPHGYVRPRDAERQPSPYHAWVKPVIVLMNEHSYSNAEIFPSAMRARGLAKLVGMPTPGYVIWTDSLRLVDGTEARMPQSGSYRLDGTTHENNGEKPDFQVGLSPEDWLAGRDPQLDKAIELLTQEEQIAAKTDENKDKAEPDSVQSADH